MYQKHDFSRYKSEINLSHYAASLGYELDPRKTTKSSLVMKHPNGDKVIISRRGSNYVYFSVSDDKDNGTIVDFIRKRTTKTFPEIGQELQKWVRGGGNITPWQPASRPAARCWSPRAGEGAWMVSGSGGGNSGGRAEGPVERRTRHPEGLGNSMTGLAAGEQRSPMLDLPRGELPLRAQLHAA